MLLNPFTPSEIASAPDDFFGRKDELRTLERSIQLGSVAIQGPIGIGKSSLLARSRLVMEGFGSNHRARSVVAVADKNVTNIDQAARLLLECFTEYDEKQRKVRLKFGSFAEFESGDVVRFFAEGRHLAALKRMLERDYLQRVLSDHEMLVLAVDEADKAPVALTQAIRSIVTHTQQEGVKGVRFVVAGVTPFFQLMVNEDPGVNRFFYKTISLAPMTREDASDLVQTKLARVVEQAKKDKLPLRVEPNIVKRITRLSGGHPHLIQLLGSHLIEHEEDDPDGVLDSRDMANALRQICYEDRAKVYNATLHMLELDNRLDVLRNLLGESAPGFPTCIPRKRAVATTEQGSLQWLVDHGILSVREDDQYGLVDEFLRVRLILDGADSPAEESRLERQLISAAVPRVAADPWAEENKLIRRIDGDDEDE